MQCPEDGVTPAEKNAGRTLWPKIGIVSPSWKLYQRYGKRLLDLAVVVAVCPVWLPCMLSGWISVRLISGAPGLYRSVRVGKGGTVFVILKLRTMQNKEGAWLTSANDVRITWIGRILRRWKVDELPQLVNVLRGEMSLIGPRPEVLKWVREVPDAFDVTLAVRPGLSDLSSLVYHDEAQRLASVDQPEEYYRTTILPNKLELGARYVANVSWRLDLWLVVVTAISVVCPLYAAMLAAKRGEQLGKRDINVSAETGHSSR